MKKACFIIPYFGKLPNTIFESIKLLLDHPEMQERFICELQKEKHENVSEVQKLYAMIKSGVS